ncbi:MAG: putative phosphoesterase [Podoviridae sp. ctbj_2]|nr:MAG: putative phosphoesterase [Podoviridae sp. ctbj_2]
MPSLSSYDVGKKSFEGRRYKQDVDAARYAMDDLLSPLEDLQRRQEANRKKVYKPELHLTLGNHENRINRAVENDPKLEGTIGIADLQYEDFGWKVYPFLEVVVIDGIAFSHYFTTGTAGRPASTANAQLNKSHMSCIAGHQQGLQIATGKSAEGKLLMSIIAGSFYLHDEEYMGQQGNQHWRGALMLHGVDNGTFDLNLLPMRYLRDKYN